MQAFLLLISLALLSGSSSLGSAVVSRTCPRIPGGGSMPCSSLFNPSCTKVIDGDLQASWFFPVNATMHSFSYANGIGQPVRCDPPTAPILCLGVLYDPSCFQYWAVRETFRKIPSRQSPDQGIVRYDHPLFYNYTIVAENGVPRQVSFPPSLRVVLTRDQVAHIQLTVRWDYQNTELELRQENYKVDHFSPENGAIGVLGFWIHWPAWVRSTKVRVIDSAPGVTPRNFRITHDCLNAGPKDNCTQRYELALHADYKRGSFIGTYDLGFTLDCRQIKCPDFESGKEHKIALPLWTGSWHPEDPWDTFGLTNDVTVFSDPEHINPISEALAWRTTGYFVYRAQAEFTITNTTLRFIKVVHKREHSGIIWDGTRVNTELVKLENLQVRCNPQTPPDGCDFDFKFDPTDPLWRDVKDEPFLTIDIHVGGRVSYKDDGDHLTLLEQESVRSFFPFEVAREDAAPGPTGRSGDAPASTSKKMALGTPSSSKKEVPGMFYAGAGLLTMSLIVFAITYRIRRQTQNKTGLLLDRAERGSYSTRDRTDPIGA